MITKLHIENFRSIVNLDVDFTYGEGRAPSGYRDMVRMPFVEDRQCGVRCVPCLAFYGANAAGKSNIMLALDALKNVVGREDVRKAYDGNLIVPTKDGLTVFRIEFANGKKIYTYEIAYGANGIDREMLKADGVRVFQYAIALNDNRETDLKRLATKAYPEDRLTEIFRVECCEGETKTWIRALLGVLGKSYQGLNEDVTDACCFILTQIKIWSDMDVQRVFPLAVDVLSEAAKISNDEATARIVSFVRKLDVEIQDIKIVDRPTADEGWDETCDFKMQDKSKELHDIVIRSRHKTINGDDVFFRFMKQESEGTKRLATIIGFMLAALEKGTTVCIDEFDWALHPMIVGELIGLFKRSDLNRKGAQLVFTTHMTDLLDDNVLRVSEACFVNKNLRVGTKVKRLVDFKAEGVDVRNITNFRRQYLYGAYQAIPHPAI